MEPEIVTAPAAEIADAPAVPDADPFDNAEIATFDREYVTRLREEAAGRRTAIKPYEDAFGAYAEDERAIWFSLARELAEDPQSAAKKFQAIAENILGADHQVTDVTPEKPAGEAQAKYLTQEDVDRIFAERETARTQEQAVETAKSAIISTAKELGYETGSEPYKELLFMAQQNGGDLKAAHTAIAARKQATIDAYLAEKAGQGGARVPLAAGAAASQANPINGFAGARAALEARLAAM